ncbi:unnamed protein product [Gongylonema pulchrum]|uniref:DUF7516 domain-containing protein n=1 Tax=Gongylonema pulchrum TaxID=637853 RepID=A0A183E246_9BILA|nr:unnamed protein product [Gongylonema pulchrum]
MLALKNPENAEAFIEGKRRILRILLDLKAYEAAVDYQKIRDEYMTRYKTNLNAVNFCRVFFREVDLTNNSPIHIRLKSPNITCNS